MKHDIDKIDVEQLLDDFRITDREALQVYLKELWKDLAQRSEEKHKGINRITFAKYYDLPGIILDRLFNVFDQDKNEYLDCSEFVEGMITLNCDCFDKLVKFIFKFYDFDRDDMITHEDIRVVLSYIPLNSQNKYKLNMLKYENANYKDRIESQDELNEMISKCFQNSKRIDFSTFNNVIENQYSEICLYILIFLLESKPFTASTLLPYQSITKSSGKSPDVKPQGKLIASPNMNSKLSPGNIIKNSPTIVKKRLDVQTSKPIGTNNVLSSLTGKSPISKLGGADVMRSKLDLLTKNSSNANPQVNPGESKNPIRKQRENLKNIEILDDKKLNKLNHNLQEDDINDMNDNDLKDIANVKKVENHQYINIKTDAPDSDNEESNIKEEIRNEGFLYKITQTKKLKILYFKLINKDLYCKYI